MKHRNLGHTGLIVSQLALGSMQFSGKMNMGAGANWVRLVATVPSGSASAWTDDAVRHQLSSGRE
jgi:aryl-alcohol dehydrogenase-like predicted oxidoreductase